MHALYSLVLLNKCYPGVDEAAAKVKLAGMLKLDKQTLERLLAKQEVVIKRKLDKEAAQKYSDSLSQTGFMVSIKEEAPPIESSLSLVAKETTDRSSEPTRQPDEAQPEAGNVYRSPQVDVDISRRVFCRHCGAQISAEATFCSACGVGQVIGSPKNKYIAGFLAIFLGFLGVHRFYLGQWWGVFYILLFLTGLSLIISIIEGIVFLCTPKVSWLRRYGNVPPTTPIVAIIVGIIAFIMVAGILASIAIPAYQDYAIRAKIGEGLSFSEQAKEQLSLFIQANNIFPESNAQAGLPETMSNEIVSSVRVSKGGLLTIQFHKEVTHQPGQTITFRPTLVNGRVEWDCSGGSLLAKYRPIACRSSSESVGGVKQVDSADGRLSVKVPSRWNMIEQLHEEAVLQVAHLRDENYLVILAESKTDFAENVDIGKYGKQVSEIILTNFEQSELISGPTSLEINGQPAFSYEIIGQAQRVNIYYYFVVAQSDEEYFQLVSWTLKSRMNTNKPTLQQITQSFKTH
ncbi:NINE protein [Zooshikella ganghwensis]|uniref:NINE protein n=1 Tax=Zooshikella ganghwensis TaxID=202772 RepID=A0A4P9VNI9_9GAMM|nr:NINE protein [Zooshikella ganghwensis]RDH43964.1 NINE protein [Zooshikella ganghwensis]